jgi:uncharacterized protein (TIGR03067 family)
MRRHVPFDSAAAPLAAADQPEQDATREDSKRLPGTWTVVSAEANGRPDQTFAGTMKIVGDRYTFYSKELEEQERMHYRLDATRDPKAIDFTIESRPYMLGIYELKGDTLLLCLRTPLQGRPTEFASKDQVRITFKRVQGEREP